MRLPGAFHASRSHPASAGLGATLRHVSGWPVLSITGSPQTLELELVNRTPHPLTAGPGRLRLVFRPGILMALDQLVLAPQSDAAWTLTVHPPAPDEDLVLELAGVDRFTLAPGEAIAVRFDGVSANPAGGSRATRVQLDFDRFFQPSGAEARGTRLLRLPVLRRHEPAGGAELAAAGGSMARCGPFIAGFVDGGDLLNDGVSENLLRLRIVNASGQAVALSHDDDAATRFTLSYRTGTAEARWGLIEAQTDHVALTLLGGQREAGGWQIDHHSLRRTAPGAWRPREALELELRIHSSAPAGEAQIVLSVENLPQADDGDLVLTLRLGPTAVQGQALVAVTPLELRGADARLRFHPEAAFGATQTTLPAPSLTVNRAEGRVGRLEIDAPAGAHLAGDLTVDGVIGPPAHFKLGGQLDRWYPLVIEDLAWHLGELRLEVFRPEAHVDGTWHGSLMVRITCHGDCYGHGSGHWSLDANQWANDSGAHKRFVGGFANDPYRPAHVLWLSGNTTYAWRAGHPARLGAVVDLAQPAAVSITGAGEPVEYLVLDQPKPGFDADHISIRRITGHREHGLEEDVSPVPVGAILLWPKDDPDIPYGWGVCDGTGARPDLRAAFPTGLVYIRKR